MTLRADIKKLREPVTMIARRAGDAILEIYRSMDPGVTYKDDDSPLTSADLAAHELIVNSLAELTPGIPVLSEESADIPFAVRSGWKTHWLVDPLDGTREFLARNGEFTVNIALIHVEGAVAQEENMFRRTDCHLQISEEEYDKTTARELCRRWGLCTPAFLAWALIDAVVRMRQWLFMCRRLPQSRYAWWAAARIVAIRWMRI